MRYLIVILELVCLAATVKADESPSVDSPPAVVYVLPPIQQQVDAATDRIDRLEAAQRQQTEVNAAILAELKALRTGTPPTLNATATATAAAMPATASKLANPNCGCVPGLSCGCNGSKACTACEASAKGGATSAASVSSAAASVSSAKPTTLPPAHQAGQSSAVAHRAPVGHTHTCPRCGTTWDHAANPGHTCANCGTAQYVQDRTPKPVAYIRPNVPPLQATPAPVAVSVAQTAPLTYSVGGCANGACSSATAAGGCSNGSCGTAGRSGWYPGKLLGR